MKRHIFSLLILTLIVSIRVHGQLNSTNVDDHSAPGCYDLPPLNHSHNYPTCRGIWTTVSNIDIANYQCPGPGLVKVLEDNFDGSSLDFNTWKVGYPWGGHISPGSVSFGGMPYSNGNLQVGGGYLYMIPKKQFVSQGSLGTVGWSGEPIPIKDFNYTEPAISTWNKWGYGKFEIRCKMSYDPVKLNTAYWLFGNCDNEIDFFETFDDINEGGIYDNNPSREHVNMRIKTSVYSSMGHCDDANRRRFSRDFHTKVPSGQTLNQWHTYTVYWNEYSIQLEIDGVNSNSAFTSMFKFYPGPSAKLCGELQDGKDYRRFSTYPYDTDHLMNLILDVAVRDESAGYLDQSERQMMVDYIKVWQYEPCGKTKNLCGAYDDATMRGTEFGYQVNISPNDCGWLLYGNSAGRSVFTAIAEDEVALLPGVDIENHTAFSAYIQPCAYTQRMAQRPVYDSIMDDQIDEDHINTLAVSPNPNKGTFTLNLPDNEKGVLKVYNSLAMLVYEQNIEGDKREISVNLTDIKSGFYYITIETGTKTYTSKFIVE